MTARTLALIAIVMLAVSLLIGSYSLAYDRGVESGMRDLCGEMGGTWTANEHGWCDQ